MEDSEYVFRSCRCCRFIDRAPRNQERCIRCEAMFDPPSDPERLLFWCGRCDLFGRAPYYEESRCAKCGQRISIARRELPEANR